MTKTLRFAASSLAVLVSLGSITACSSQSSEPSPSASAPASASGSKLHTVNGKIDPPVTITTVRGTDPTARFKSGETYENNVHTKWAKEALGVDMKTLWSAPQADGSYDTKLKLMLSSGDKLPDIIYTTNKDTLNMFIDSGKVMPIDSVFDKYAGKAWKAGAAEQPDAWLPFGRGKQKMAIPRLQPTLSSEPVLWIRKDWMDKLGLQAPKSLADLETIMDAFANRDPDGNGKKDTIPLDFGMKDQMIGYAVGDISWLFGAYGSIPGQWNKDADGKLAFGSVQPGIKPALAKLKEWKDKGYIAEDIGLHDWNKVVEDVASGKVGIVAGQYWFPSYPGSMAYAKDPKADYEPYALPPGPDGKKGNVVNEPFLGGVVINKDISQEALEAFFHYMNTLWDAGASGDPLALKGFQEHYDYEIQDGQQVNNVDDKAFNTEKYTLLSWLPYPLSKVDGDAKKDAADPNPLTARQGKAKLIAIDQKGSDMPDLFTGPTTSTQSTRGEFLRKLELDTFTQIIYGKAPVDEFDNFVKQWKASGGDQVTKEVNDWFNSVK